MVFTYSGFFLSTCLQEMFSMELIVKSNRNLAYCDPNVDPTPVALGILLHVDILLKGLHL